MAKRFDLIALDADDTLWHNEIYYRQGREIFNEILAKYGVPEPDHSLLDQIEIANLEFYGYGAIGFAVSLAEAAMQMTERRIDSQDLMTLLTVSKTIISAEVELFDGVEAALHTLAQTHALMLITKGNELHQASKVERSGLRNYFEHIEIVTDKNPTTYAGILDKVRIPADRFLMVGNAMRSDILPVLEIGGSTVYIHNDLTWAHEHQDSAGLPHERFFEIDSISSLPGLIKRIENKGS